MSYAKFEEGGKIQNQAIIYDLGVHQKAPILAIEGDMGWIRTKVRHWVAMLKLWNKLIQMPDDCLIKRCLLGIMIYVKIGLLS